MGQCPLRRFGEEIRKCFSFCHFAVIYQLALLNTNRLDLVCLPLLDILRQHITILRIRR